MPGEFRCPFCGLESVKPESRCRECGIVLDGEKDLFPQAAEIARPGSAKNGDLQAGDLQAGYARRRKKDAGHEGDELGPRKDDFSELDYRPGIARRIALPLVAVLVLIVIVGGAVAIVGGFLPDTISSAFTGLPGGEEDGAEDRPEGPAGDADSGAESEDGSLGNDGQRGEVSEGAQAVTEEPDYGPPDPDLLLPALEEWTAAQVQEEDLILIHNSELDDFDRFFAEYDLDRDFIIVYDLESSDDDFATFKLGVPFSEWSLKAVFVWRQGRWDFLRQEEIR